ncbi:FK506-binding protein 59-like [Culicoides brevitarsis]|uniref:FK506-binding protein 59-like n=1 Tax=Culicoides brevitarsis TaxID=469753 RepID=UPI00307B484B
MSEEKSIEEVSKIELKEGEIDLSGDGRVSKLILKEGEGDETPQDGCRVSLHYTGKLTNGTQFDSSVERNEPFEFDLGKGSVIKAFDMGVASMKKGEKCVLTCGSEYAYGEAGSPPNIPPNATLLFELELLGWKGEDLSPRKSDGIIRYTIVKGTKKGSPKEGSFVKIKLKGTYEGRVFEEREVEFNIGEGLEQNIVDGVEIALEKFKEGEKSRLEIAAEYAFGAEGNKEFGIPAGATVNYEVELLTFEKVKNSWELDDAEKLEQATLLKEQGNKYLKESKLLLALKKYNRAKGYLTGFVNETDAVKQLQIAVHSNLSLLYQKQNNNDEVFANCNKVLELDPKNVKALYRRGMVRITTQDFEQAIADFNAILEVEPNNKAAQNQITIAKHHIAEYKKKEKKLYSNMFTKFATRDKNAEDEAKKGLPDVMNSKFGEWNAEEREREPTKFEQENPDVLMLNGSSKEFQNM